MNDTQLNRSVTALERIAMTLGALYAQQLGDVGKGLKAKALRKCGFSNAEIGRLFGVGAHSIRAMISGVRKGRNISRSRAKTDKGTS